MKYQQEKRHDHPAGASEYEGVLPEDSGRAKTFQLYWLQGLSGRSWPWPRFIMLQKKSPIQVGSTRDTLCVFLSLVMKII